MTNPLKSFKGKEEKQLPIFLELSTVKLVWKLILAGGHSVRESPACVYTERLIL